MPRISKDPEERRNEIISVAEELFNSQGFDETAVSDIVKRIGVAQGLFYYYFKSKDEVLDAIMDRYADLILENTQTIVGDSTLLPPAKFQRSLALYFEIANGRDELVEHIHQKSFEAMHQRMVDKMMKKLIPFYSDIVREGMREGLFKLEDPDVTVEIVLTGLEHYLNKMVRECWGGPEFYKRVHQAIGVLEQALGATKGSLQITTGGEIDE